MHHLPAQQDLKQNSKKLIIKTISKLPSQPLYQMEREELRIVYKCIVRGKIRAKTLAVQKPVVRLICHLQLRVGNRLQ